MKYLIWNKPNSDLVPLATCLNIKNKKIALNHLYSNKFIDVRSNRSAIGTKLITVLNLMKTDHRLYFLLQFRRIYMLLWSYWQHCQFRKQQQISGICLWSWCWIVCCCFDTHCPQCHWKEMDSNYNAVCLLLVFCIFRRFHNHRWVFVFFFKDSLF